MTQIRLPPRRLRDQPLAIPHSEPHGRRRPRLLRLQRLRCRLLGRHWRHGRYRRGRLAEARAVGETAICNAGGLWLEGGGEDGVEACVLGLERLEGGL